MNAPLASSPGLSGAGQPCSKASFLSRSRVGRPCLSFGKGFHFFFPNDWFPSNHLLAKLQKVLSKARESRKHQDHPFIADTSLESWVPMWVGHGESPSAREALVKQRRKTENLGAQVLEPCCQFLAGQFPDVFAHLLMLIRMSAEHGLSYALHYETKLHYGLQSLTHSSKKFNFSDLLHQGGLLTSWTSSTTAPRVANMMTSPCWLGTREMPSGLTSPAVRRRRPGAASLLQARPGHLDTTDPEQARRHAAALKAMRPKKTCLLGLERRRGQGEVGKSHFQMSCQMRCENCTVRAHKAVCADMLVLKVR